ncbi:MAG: Bifunctional IPC transferase and DIPP synthase [Candidatus Bathyarchaeota archaeon BA1]|nr:MAG: Bifunctional IPC transferase and DIPP synthase [Candidatus Bathyarchaeota archaeon BA1]
MKAAILAAGEGKRLGELTKETPKPLVPVAGVPLICRVLRNLRGAGVTEAYVVIGYKGHKIQEEIGNNYAGVRIRYLENPYWQKGNLHSLLILKGFLDENFLLCMSDHIFDDRMAKGLIHRDLKGVVMLVAEKRESPEDTKVLTEYDKILDIGKSIGKSVCVDTGLFLFSPGIFDYADQAAKEGKSELADCIRLAAEGGKAEVFYLSEIPSYVPGMRRDVDPFWFDVDKKDDIKYAKRILVKSAGKGASDFLAHYVHQFIEDKIVYHISDLKIITPNRLTIMTNIMAYCVTWLFLFGHLLTGSILAFMVGIMDGLDGKLARVRGHISRLGSMEHPFDLLYEFSWFIALSLYVYWNSNSALPLIICTFIVISIAFYRYCYDQFRKAMGVSLDDYGKFERVFRRVAGRRNLYNISILIGALLEIPLYSLIAILAHAILTAIVYAFRAVKHMHDADKLQF